MAKKYFRVKLADFKKNKSQTVLLTASNTRQAGILARKVSELKTIIKTYQVTI